MPRAKRGNKRLERRKKILKLAKGYRGTKSKLYRSAKESVQRGLYFAYTGRKLKKRDFRSLWIVRIGAAARLNGLNYSQFMHGLKLSSIRSRIVLRLHRTKAQEARLSFALDCAHRRCGTAERSELFAVHARIEAKFNPISDCTSLTPDESSRSETFVRFGLCASALRHG